MSSSENLAALWEQAIADENWELAASFEAQQAQTVSTPESNAVQEQRAIMSAELYWFGGIADHGRVHFDGPRDIM